MYRYTNRDVPFVKDHANALRIFNSITPLRTGPRKGWKPIGARRKTGQHIWVDMQGNVHITEVGWSGTNHCEVTFYKDNLTVTVAWPTGYMGASCMGFVSTLLGIELNMRGNRPWVHGVVVKRRKPDAPRWANNDEHYDRIIGSYPMFKGALMRFERSVKYPNELLLQDPIHPVVRTINKPGAKEIRNRYRPFTLVMKGALGLFNKGFTSTDYAENDINSLSREDMRTLIESPSPLDHMRAVMWLAKANKSWGRNHWNGGDNDGAWTATKHKIWEDYDRMILGWHEGTAYDWTTRYDGKVYRDHVKLNLGARG